MNKFIAIIGLALACIATASNGAVYGPNDNSHVYSQFCANAGKRIEDDIKSRGEADLSGKIVALAYKHGDELAYLDHRFDYALERGSRFDEYVRSVAHTGKSDVTIQFQDELKRIKEESGLEKATEALNVACGIIEEYYEDLRESFKKAEAKIAPEDLDCTASIRVIRLDGICKVSAASQNPLVNFVYYKPKFFI